MVIGPPGCGKTTALCEKAAEAVAKWGGSSVLICSLTRSAAAEIKRRDIKIPAEQIGTIHHHCYYALGCPTLAESRIKEWNEDSRSVGFRINSGGYRVGDSESDDTRKIPEFGDECYQAYSLRRARMEPQETAVFTEFTAKWEAWKSENDYLDFSDLIDRARLDCDYAPRRPQVIYLDECIASGVKVTMADGTEKDIKEIVENKTQELVASFNVCTQKFEAKKITGWHKVLRKGRPIRQIGRLRATGDHPILTTRNNYCKIDSLHILDSVLEVDCEKLRCNRQFHETRTVDYYRVASWRRVSDKMPQRREQHVLCSAFNSSGTVSRMEVSTSEAMVQSPPLRSIRHGIRRSYISDENQISSAIQQTETTVLSTNSLETSRQKVCPQTSTVLNRQYGFGCVVYGRWKQRTIRSKLLYCWIRHAEQQKALSPLSINGLPKHRADNNKGSGYLSKCREFSIVFQAVEKMDSPTTEVQIRFQAETSSETRQSANSEMLSQTERPGAMRNLRKTICQKEGRCDLQQRMLGEKTVDGCCPLQKNEAKRHRRINQNLRAVRLRFQINSSIFREAQHKKNVFSAVPRTIICCKSKRQNTNSTYKKNRLYNLQTEIRDCCPKNTPVISENVLLPLSRDISCEEPRIQGNSENEFVYCIDVEHNHNFVAGGIVVHNCQDSSRAEIKLLLHWSQDANLVMTGDIDQSIFTWRGADPQAFYDLEIPPHRKRVLSQSYRIPRAVHRAATTWINQIQNREQIEYKPRDFDGEVLQCRYTYKTAEKIIEFVEPYLTGGKSVMFLGACSFHLDPLVAVMRRQGIPFHNPYRVKNGRWNPLARRNGTTAVDRIEAFLEPQTQGRWSLRAMNRWIQVVKSEGFLVRGAKTQLKRWVREKVVFNDEMLGSLFCGGSVAAGEAIEAAWDGNYKWFRDRLADTKTQSLDFPIRIADKYGIDELSKQPQITIGTIHSLKGTENDVVLVFPDLSRAGRREWFTPGEGHDSTVRLFYVAMTRARETLILCAPGGPMHVSWGNIHDA